MSRQMILFALVACIMSLLVSQVVSHPGIRPYTHQLTEQDRKVTAIFSLYNTMRTVQMERRPMPSFSPATLKKSNFYTSHLYYLIQRNNKIRFLLRQGEPGMSQYSYEPHILSRKVPLSP